MYTRSSSKSCIARRVPRLSSSSSFYPPYFALPRLSPPRVALYAVSRKLASAHASTRPSQWHVGEASELLVFNPDIHVDRFHRIYGISRRERRLFSCRRFTSSRTNDCLPLSPPPPPLHSIRDTPEGIYILANTDAAIALIAKQDTITRRCRDSWVFPRGTIANQLEIERQVSRFVQVEGGEYIMDCQRNRLCQFRQFSMFFNMLHRERTRAFLVTLNSLFEILILQHDFKKILRVRNSRNYVSIPPGIIIKFLDKNSKVNLLL